MWCVLAPDPEPPTEAPMPFGDEGGCELVVVWAAAGRPISAAAAVLKIRVLNVMPLSPFEPSGD
jgi:hypothetical protein